MEHWGRRVSFGLSGCSRCISAGYGCGPAGGGVQGHLFREEECDTAVTDGRMAWISPVANRLVGQTSSEYVARDAYYVRLCLLHPDSVEDLLELRDGYVDNQ